jgi:hypothetical protein
VIWAGEPPLVSTMAFMAAMCALVAGDESFSLG